MTLPIKAREALQRPLPHRIASHIQDRSATRLLDLAVLTGAPTAAVWRAIITLEQAGIIQSVPAAPDTSESNVAWLWQQVARLRGRPLRDNYQFIITQGIVVPPAPLPSARRLRVARHIVANPGLDVRQIAEQLDLQPHRVAYEVHALAEAALLISSSFRPLEGLVATPRLEDYLREIERL